METVSLDILFPKPHALSQGESNGLKGVHLL